MLILDRWKSLVVLRLLYNKQWRPQRCQSVPYLLTDALFVLPATQQTRAATALSIRAAAPSGSLYHPCHTTNSAMAAPRRHTTSSCGLSSANPCRSSVRILRAAPAKQPACDMRCIRWLVCAMSCVRDELCLRWFVCGGELYVRWVMFG